MVKSDSFVLDLLDKALDLKDDGKNLQSITILEQILISNPDFVDAYEELGDNYLTLRKLDKAEKALTQALHLNPKSSNAHYLLGFLYSIKEDWINSILAFKKADINAPNHPEILRCLGWAFYNGNRQSQGISILERSRNLNPEDINILCDLGICYMNSVYYDKAKQVFLEVLQIDPFFEQAKEHLLLITTLEDGLKSISEKPSLGKKESTKKKVISKKKPEDSQKKDHKKKSS